MSAQPGAGRRIFRRTWRALLAVFITWVLVQLDPIGLSSATDAEAQRVFQRIFLAPWYRGAQEQVTVILIDNDYLARVDRAWPLPYAYQRRLIETILHYNPKALYVDLLYRQRHSADELPAELFEHLRGEDVPVIVTALAQVPSGSEPGTNCSHDEVRPADDVIDAASIDGSLLPLLTPHPSAGERSLSAAYVNWYGCGSRYPMYLGGNPDVRTPAFALYALGREQAWSAEERRRFFDEHADPLVVRWGGIQSRNSYQLSSNELNCKPFDDSWSGRLGLMGSQILATLSRLATTGPRGIRLPCLYVDVLLASQLLESEPGSYQEMLNENRYVLLGLGISGVPDTFVSPVNGLVPGVFLHAMALDNLLTYESGYLREVPIWASLCVSLIAALVLGFAWPQLTAFRCRSCEVVSAYLSLLVWAGVALVLFVTAHPGGAFMALMAGLGLDWLRKQTMVYFLLIAAPLALLLSLLLVQWFSWEPLNWIALTAFLLAAHETLSQQEEKDRERDRRFRAGEALTAIREDRYSVVHHIVQKLRTQEQAS